MSSINEAALGIDPRVLTVPVERLGRLLGVARVRGGVSRVEVARRLRWSYGPTILSLIEGGQYAVPGGDIPSLVRAYAVDTDALFPGRDRLVVDLRRGRLTAGRKKAKIGKRLSVDEALAEYLSFVRSLRNLGPEDRIEPESLRIDDIVELACALELDGSEVERRLRGLIDRAGEPPSPDHGSNPPTESTVPRAPIL